MASRLELERGCREIDVITYFTQEGEVVAGLGTYREIDDESLFAMTLASITTNALQIKLYLNRKCNR